MTRANKRVATVEQLGNSALQTEGESLAGTSRSNENNTLQIAEVNRTNMRDVSVSSHSSNGHSNLGNYLTTGLSTRSLRETVESEKMTPSENPRFNNYGKTQCKQVASIKSGVSVPGPSCERSLSTVQCFGCKEFGHVRRNCPNSRDNDGSRERSGGGGGGMSCDYCHYENHGVEQCYLKRKHDP